ncbi:hypothetical protein GobsT_51020 [Gemmata obscuriglobus]|uniref:hypothetical protein n=1 Tax=Gemmata obscuriglobus TaxID=114 RepID=UPI00016C4D48|nr:hypothetical protein [Gemmata obscuriglobus]QEG30298.1 hypothetical protein GobsT_51020 [Gemmata obscuriglobus]VTS09622.1 unnamed protein product [Gemmata obscuriglobus UQM 2246]
MTATQPTNRKNSKKASTARPVPAMLLELAYLMHATKVVGVRETPAPRQVSGRSI